MRALRLIVAAFVAAAIPLLAAAPAHATLTGPCQASGTVNGKTYDAHIAKATIPRKGSVHWQGSIPGSGKRPISGEVKIKLPFFDIPIGAGSWGKNSDTYSNSGVYKYDLPSEFEGFDIPVTGHHSEPGKACAGVVIVRLQGNGGFSNPAVIGTFALTIISGVLLIISFKPKVV
jgi:hypothetical protein